MLRDPVTVHSLKRELLGRCKVAAHAVKVHGAGCKLKPTAADVSHAALPLSQTHPVD
jgi:hypothetical protein